MRLTLDHERCPRKSRRFNELVEGAMQDLLKNHREKRKDTR